jgi:outer membrane autotransporter protein
MKAGQRMYAQFPKSTMAISIGLALLMVQQQATARTLNGSTETITSGAPVESWTLLNRAVLNVNGATTSGIRALSGSVVNLNPGALVQSEGVGVALNQATGVFNGARIESTGDYGLFLNTDLAGTRGTVASVTDSTIIGQGRGVSVAAGDVTLSGTTVQGNSAGGTGFLNGGIGVALFNGNATITNQSSITGEQNGILVSPDASLPSQQSNIIVDNSSVTGTNGSAIIVGSFRNTLASSSDITIRNGSTLSGGNGVILEVANNSSARITVDDSALTGDVLISDGSTGALTLQNNASITGNITNVANLNLNNNAGVTGTITRADSLSVLNGSRIDGDVSDVTTLTANGNASTAGTISRVSTFNVLNGSRIESDVADVTNLSMTSNSSSTGNITRVQTFDLDTGSRVSGQVSDVQTFNVSGNSELSGQLANVDQLNLNNSTWITSDGQGVSRLNMSAGLVRLGAGDGTFETLNVSTLSGSGRFIMDTDLATHQSDLLNVSGQAAGDYDLQIKNTGVDPVKGEDEQRVVHTGAGSTAQFSVVGGQVDFGTFAYELEQRDNEWYLVQKFDDEGDPEVTPGTRSVIGLFSAAPTVWYGELSSLRSRMGELRYGEAEGGAWTRAYGNKYNMSAAGGTAYQQNQHGVSFGADAPLPVADGQWLVGVLAGYSRSDLDIAAGTSGHVDSYYLGAYTTWLSDSGYYVDAVVKANRFKNTSDVRMSDGEKSEGDYNTSGIGASVEVGKHIKLQDDWFVEPFAQVSTLWVKGEDYSLDNGMDASSNKADSFLGKLGTTVGRNFPLDKGGYVQPYVKIAAAHEFAKSNRVKVNDNTFSNDLSGSRGELGAGIAAQLTDVLQLHADVDYSNGQNIEQPWGVNVGLRYNW